MKRLFDENLYRFAEPQPSYWEATADKGELDVVPVSGEQGCEVAIIGGGYTGLSAALHLARDYGIDTCLLEAGHIGWGASGRNGGFCSTGGTGLHRRELVKVVGLDNTRDYYHSQVMAVQLVRDLIESESIDCEPHGQAELEVAHTPRAYARLCADHELLTGPLGFSADLVGADECRRRFYDSTETHGALITRPTFGLHPLRYCRGLARAAIAHGARLHDHSEVIEWSTPRAGKHRLVTVTGSVTADRVIYATNGFMPECLRSEFFGRTIPVISAIIVTRPLTSAERQAQNWRSEDPAINSRRILNYFRMLPDGRFLFGGRGDVTGRPEKEQQTYQRLHKRLGQIWPAWRDVDIDYRWHGLICTTASVCPAIGRLVEDESVLFAYGYHGNGVNTATWSGKQLADWVGTGREPGSLPAIVRGLGRRYPLPIMRKSYLRSLLFVARQLDRYA